MKKKPLFVISAATCSVAAMLAVALSNSASFTTLFAKTRQQRTHLIQFAPSEMQENNSGDTEPGNYFFYFSKQNAFQDQAENSYDFSLENSSAYFYYSGSNSDEWSYGQDTNPFFISFVSNADEVVNFSFKLKNVTLTENSYFTVNYEYYEEEDIRTTVNDFCHFEVVGSDNGYDIYMADYHNFSNAFGETVNIGSVQLEFTCN